MKRKHDLKITDIFTLEIITGNYIFLISEKLCFFSLSTSITFITFISLLIIPQPENSSVVE